MKQLDNSHLELAINYFAEEPEFNLFLINDIANCGMKGDIVNTYTADDWDGGEFPYFILDYMGNFLVYSKDPDYDAKTVAEFLSSKKPDNLSGKQEIVEKLCPYFPKRPVQRTYMARLNEVNSDFTFPDIPTRKLTENDMEDIYELYMMIDEFAPTYKNKTKERILDGFRQNMTDGCYYGLYNDGVLAAIAAAGASTAESAMIVGVATRPDCRKRGYASAVVGTMCRDAIAEGRKFLCLFYDNPEAGRIYQKVGFKELGIYTMLRQE